jgi:hypothetical protein
MKNHLWVVLLGYLFALPALSLLNGCSLVGKGRITAAEADQARRAIDRLARVNHELAAFKAVGRIKIQGEGPYMMRVNERAAWVAALPHNLSLVILSSGRPVFKLATDGHHLYLVDLTNPKRSYQKLPSADDGLKRLISLPLTPGDVVAFLSGRIPLVEHSTAALIKSEDDDRYVLILKKWWQVKEKVYLDEAASEVREVEYFDYDGKLRYRVQFEGIQEVQGFRVPVRLLITNDSGIDVQVDIDRFTAETSIPPSMFILTPPDI